MSGFFEMHDTIYTWYTARLMIEQHGDLAELRAAIKADKLLKASDLKGGTEWRRISTAINAMQGSDAAEH